MPHVVHTPHTFCWVRADQFAENYILQFGSIFFTISNWFLSVLAGFSQICCFFLNYFCEICQKTTKPWNLPKILVFFYDPILEAVHKKLRVGISDLMVRRFVDFYVVDPIKLAFLIIICRPKLNILFFSWQRSRYRQLKTFYCLFLGNFYLNPVVSKAKKWIEWRRWLKYWIKKGRNLN